MARAIALKSKAGYTCAVVPQFRSDEMLAKREESIYGTSLIFLVQIIHTMKNQILVVSQEN
jgi:hypothetical protein